MGLWGLKRLRRQLWTLPAILLEKAIQVLLPLPLPLLLPPPLSLRPNRPVSMFRWGGIAMEQGTTSKRKARYRFTAELTDNGFGKCWVPTTPKGAVSSQHRRKPAPDFFLPGDTLGQFPLIPPYSLLYSSYRTARISAPSWPLSATLTASMQQGPVSSYKWYLHSLKGSLQSNVLGRKCQWELGPMFSSLSINMYHLFPVSTLLQKMYNRERTESSPDILLCLIRLGLG